MDALAPRVVNWSAAARPRRGEAESGDGYFIDVTTQRALIAVVDGLGHGELAAAATRTALAIVTLHRRESLPTIAKHCHEGLPHTRGGVMGLARFDASDDTLAWLGIGNVAGNLLRVHGGYELLMRRGGLLGRSLPALGPSVMKVASGDTLVITTDGIRWREDDIPIEAPDLMAQSILEEYGSGDDDAVVVVARYQGNGPR